jgi:transposase
VAGAAALPRRWRIEIDNSAERALREMAIGRRNYLIGTTRLNGIDPETCLRHVLARIADHPANRVEELRHSAQ